MQPYSGDHSGDWQKVYTTHTICEWLWEFWIQENTNKTTSFYIGFSLVIWHCIFFFKAENDVGPCHIISECCLVSSVNSIEGKRWEWLFEMRKYTEHFALRFVFVALYHVHPHQCKLYSVAFWSLFWCCVKHKWPHGSICYQRLTLMKHHNGLEVLLAGLMLALNIYLNSTEWVLLMQKKTEIECFICLDKCKCQVKMIFFFG